MNIKYFAQHDPTYGWKMYSNHRDEEQTIETSGCGPTAFSIVVSSLNKINITPPEVCKYALKHGFRTYNSGTSEELFKYAATDKNNTKYNLKYEYTKSVNEVIEKLKDNKHLVIANMGSGHVTKEGHYIVLSGYKKVNGKLFFEVYDPHKFNEYYIYDGEIIDKIKDDGHILLSKDAVEEEGQNFYIFSHE